jgi:hypothetical protein
MVSVVDRECAPVDDRDQRALTSSFSLRNSPL